MNTPNALPGLCNKASDVYHFRSERLSLLGRRGRTGGIVMPRKKRLEHWTPTPEIEDALSAGFGVAIRKHQYSRFNGSFGPGTSGTDEIYAVIHGNDRLYLNGQWRSAGARTMAFFRRNEVYGVEHGSDGSGTHQILTILFRAPESWQCGVPRLPIRMSPIWWRTLMSLEDLCDYDAHGQRVIATERLLEFLENFSAAGLTQRKGSNPVCEEAPRRPDTEAEWMETWAAAEDVIRQRAGSGLTADELAEAVHVSPAKLRRIFQIARGLSPKAALTKWRVEQAQKLLAHRNLTVTQVASQVGYSTVQRFCAAFKQVSGQTPGEFIRQYSAR